MPVEPRRTRLDPAPQIAADLPVSYPSPL